MTDAAALEDIAINGLIFNPLKGFVLSEKDVDVNYIIALKKPES